MSGWLSSVNNLLENLDGQAENVAETVAEQTSATGLSNNLRRLNNTIANNANAITKNITHSNDTYEDDYDDDDSAFFDDDDFDDDGFTTDEDAYDVVDELPSDGVTSTANLQKQDQVLQTSRIMETPSTKKESHVFQTPRMMETPSTAQLDQVFQTPRTTETPSTKITPVTNQQIKPLQNTPKQQNLTESKTLTVASTQKEKSNNKDDKTNEIEIQSEEKKEQKEQVSELKSAASTSITKSSDTKSQTREMKEQKADDSELLRKEQQQHQKILMSKNKTIKSLESQLVKLREELTKGAAQHEKLNLQTKDLREKLQESEQEIQAQSKELLKAGEEMELIRTNAREEREDLQDDHADEMEDIQRNHQEALDKMRRDYEKTISEWKELYQSEESLRQREGGDSIKELQEANKREREALKKLAEVTEERTALKSKLNEVVGHETELQQQVESSLESAETVAAREQRARDELDEAAASHAKQMAQRQKREAELEQTILELNSALTLAKQQQSASSAGSDSKANPAESKGEQIDGSYYKDQAEQFAEELENVKVQFVMETQRREALQHELAEVSKERKEELSLAQSQRHQYDQKVSDLESTIHRLQASARISQQQLGPSGDTVGSAHDNLSNSQTTVQRALVNHELEEAKQEISKLSEQLLRQQVLVKNTKSENLALKGRLQDANTRAEDAEKAQFNYKNKQMRSRGYDVESGVTNNAAGSFSVRRRVKGGSSRSVRSIRSALPCFGPGRVSNDGPVLEQVALTIDAIDSWMVDTGSFMRHEPYARLGLLLYLIILHLWSFALVAFHTTEVEHGDFGSMDSNPRHWREHN